MMMVQGILLFLIENSSFLVRVKLRFFLALKHFISDGWDWNFIVPSIIELTSPLYFFFFKLKTP